MRKLYLGTVTEKLHQMELNKQGILFYNYYIREERLNPTPLKENEREFLSVGVS